MLFCEKKNENLKRILFIFLHWHKSSKSQRNPTEFGPPVYQPAKKEERKYRQMSF